jgi:hypothetical protein
VALASVRLGSFLGNPSGWEAGSVYLIIANVINLAIYEIQKWAAGDE